MPFLSFFSFLNNVDFFENTSFVLPTTPILSSFSSSASASANPNSNFSPPSDSSSSFSDSSSSAEASSSASCSASTCSTVETDEPYTPPKRKMKFNFCQGCYQRDCSLEFFRRHILEQFVAISVGQEKSCVDRSEITRAFTCPWKNCYYQTCDSEKMRTHLFSCQGKPKNLQLLD